jgi:hypothetical protein
MTRDVARNMMKVTGTTKKQTWLGTLLLENGAETIDGVD